MQREAVRIAADLRQFVVDAIVEKLQRDDIEVLVASVDAKHLHLVARFEDHRPRHWVGRAKKHSSHLLRQEGLREDQGGLWAKRARADPITGRQHQLNCFRYILGHAAKGAAVWRIDRVRK